VFKGKTSLIFYSFIMCALFFFMEHRFLFFKPGILEQIASVIVYPFVRLQKIMVKPLHNFFAHRNSIAQLQHTIAELRTQKKELLAELIAAHSELWYQEQTKELIDFSSRYNLDGLPCAQIIMKQFSPHEHSFLIDFGSVHGAEIDMVALYKNCIIGRISQIYPYYSKVLCTTDPLCKIPVYCNRSHAKGIYEGTLNQDAAVLHYVSHLETLERDELVISSGEGVIFPQGFAVGTIEWHEPEGLYYAVGVKPLLYLQDIEYCCLIKKGAL